MTPAPRERVSIPSVAALVGCNRKVKQVKRVACGFRNHDDNVLRMAINAGQKHYRPERRPERPPPLNAVEPRIPCP